MPKKRLRKAPTSQASAKRLRIIKKADREVPQPAKTPQLPLLTWITCTICSAILLSTDPKSFCCGGGDKNLIPLPHISHELLQLIQNNKHLQEYPRKYNNAFSFSALGVQGDVGFKATPKPPANLVIHGRTYHWMPSGDSPVRSTLWNSFKLCPLKVTVPPALSDGSSTMVLREKRVQQRWH